MTVTTPGILAAAMISAIVTAVELNSSLTKPLAIRHPGIAGWLLARLMLDLAATLIVIAIVLPLADRSAAWSSGLVGGIVAGLGGPVLLRLQLATLKGGKEHSALGLGRQYGRLRRIIDEALDDHGAVAQSTWLTTEVMPKIVKLSLTDIEKFTCNYIRSTSRFTDRDKEKYLRTIRSVCADSATGDNDRKWVITQNMIDLGGRRIVAEMIRDSKAAAVA